MTVAQWIGLVLFFSPFVGAFVAIAIIDGLRVASGVFAASIVVTAVVYAGAYLLTGGK